MLNIKAVGDVVPPWGGDEEALEAQFLRAVFEGHLGAGGFTRRQLAAIFRRFERHCHSQNENPKSEKFPCDYGNRARQVESIKGAS